VILETIFDNYLNQLLLNLNRVINGFSKFVCNHCVPLGEGCTPSVENPPPIIKAFVTVNPLAVNPVVKLESSKH
jgi:hypothetical protein